jgi:hypothetical protein
MVTDRGRCARPTVATNVPVEIASDAIVPHPLSVSAATLSKRRTFWSGMHAILPLARVWRQRTQPSKSTWFGARHCGTWGDSRQPGHGRAHPPSQPVAALQKLSHSRAKISSRSERRFMIGWTLHAPGFWHYTLAPYRCIKLGASFAIPPVARRNVTEDRLSRIVTSLRERD